MAGDPLVEEHLHLAIGLLSSTTVVAIFYALVFILYFLSFRLSYARLRDDHGKIKRLTVCTLVFQTVLLICATLDVIVNNCMAQVRYIDNSTLPGGPLGRPSALSVAIFTQTGKVANMAENFLILGVLVWRIWVVWSGTRFAIPFTIGSVFVYLANAVIAILLHVITWNIDNTSLVARPRALSIITITSLAFSITSQVFITSTIIARLLSVRQKHIKSMGKSDIAGQYFGIVAIIIESDALETLWGIGLFISYGLKYAPTANLFNTCVTQVDILINFLLIYRVLSGRAWTRQTEDRLSSLRWASNGAGTTTSEPGTVYLRQTSVPEENPSVISFRDGV